MTTQPPSQVSIKSSSQFRSGTNMMLTLSLAIINIHSDGSCAFGNDTLERLAASGILGKRRVSYKFYLNNRELQLTCPLLKILAKENVVLWPAAKLPYRKYPVYVYLYAVTLYLRKRSKHAGRGCKSQKCFRSG